MPSTAKWSSPGCGAAIAPQPQNAAASPIGASQLQHAGMIFSSELDRLAAAAGALDVRVLEFEPMAHHRFHEIEPHPVEKLEALGVDEHPDTAFFDDGVLRPRVLVRPFEQIGKP